MRWPANKADHHTVQACHDAHCCKNVNGAMVQLTCNFWHQRGLAMLDHYSIPWDAKKGWLLTTAPNQSPNPNGGVDYCLKRYTMGAAGEGANGSVT